MVDPNWRRDVRIPDLPYRWDTNLDDEALFDFFLIVDQTPDFQNYVESPDVKGFGISLWGDWIPFREGFCWCFGFGDWFYVLYRTPLEWEIWEARKQELRELKDEQEREQAEELRRYWDLDRVMFDKMDAALRRGDYGQAEQILNLRVDAIHESPLPAIQNEMRWFLPNKALPALSRFPSPQPGLRLLKRLNAPYYRYVHLAAELYAANKHDTRARAALARETFDFALVQFPRDPFLYKEICLFLQRQREFAAAIDYCEEAVSHGLHEPATKTGFVGRLKRLTRMQGDNS